MPCFNFLLEQFVHIAIYGLIHIYNLRAVVAVTRTLIGTNMNVILKQLCHTSMLVATLTVTGCSHIFNSHIEYEAVQPEQYPMLTAIGYAPIEQQSGQDIETKILQAMTASKAQAYQELVAQVHGLAVTGSQNIGALVLHDTTLETQVMGVIRGAKVKQSFKQGNSTYVTELSLDMRRAADLLTISEKRQTIKHVHYY